MLTTTNIWELYWILRSQMTKTFRDNCDTNFVQQTSCKPLFPQCANAVKNVLFHSFLCQCMHHSYGVISESHACKDCMWPISLDAELYTACPREQVFRRLHTESCYVLRSGLWPTAVFTQAPLAVSWWIFSVSTDSQHRIAVVVNDVVLAARGKTDVGHNAVCKP